MIICFFDQIIVPILVISALLVSTSAAFAIATIWINLDAIQEPFFLPKASQSKGLVSLVTILAMNCLVVISCKFYYIINILLYLLVGTRIF